MKFIMGIVVNNLFKLCMGIFVLLTNILKELKIKKDHLFVKLKSLNDCSIILIF